ncbi:MAG TPA: two-component regulator propeller domain-containing protein [Phycisphaerales bacterium]|nr:two-component regulator propeller domain-containing protein [Phycisphaerales bacterium]
MSSSGRQPHAIQGEVVVALDKNIGIVYVAKDNTRWFGSNGSGVYRSDGKTIVQFTTEHGLTGDDVRDIQEDRAGNILVASEPGGISRFDGRAFSQLPVVADPPKNQWSLGPDDLWFRGGQDSGVVYRYDGATLHRLALPKTGPGEEHIAMYPRSKFPGMKYSPYDVYTIYRDRKGHLWFGTGSLGVCRYDGTSFVWAPKTEVGFGPNDSFGVRSIIEGRDGRFWFSNTFNRYDVHTGTSPSADGHGTRHLRFTKEPGIDRASDKVAFFMSSAVDGNGDLWLATYADVWRYDGKTITRVPVESADGPVMLLSMTRDQRGDLWLGTRAHGVFKFNGGVFKRFAP